MHLITLCLPCHSNRIKHEHHAKLQILQIFFDRSREVGKPLFSSLLMGLSPHGKNVSWYNVEQIAHVVFVNSLTTINRPGVMTQEMVCLISGRRLRHFYDSNFGCGMVAHRGVRPATQFAWKCVSKYRTQYYRDFFYRHRTKYFYPANMTLEDYAIVWK